MSAPLDPRVRTVLSFLEVLTLDPQSSNADACQALGVSADALRNAITVAALFNIIDRVADALDLTPESKAFSPRMMNAGSRIALRRGYRLPLSGTAHQKLGFDDLANAVLRSPGALDAQVREAIADRAGAFALGAAGGPDVPPEVECLVDTVAQHAYKLVDTDVDQVLSAGVSQDAVFETIIAAAFGAGRARLERGLALV